MSNVSSASPDPTYTGHATYAATAGGAAAVVAVWLASQFHIDLPPDVAIAMTVIFSPFASVAMKKFGIASA